MIMLIKKNSFVIICLLIELVIIGLIIFSPSNFIHILRLSHINDMGSIYTNIINFQISLIIGVFIASVINYAKKYHRAVFQNITISAINTLVSILLWGYISQIRALAISVILAIISLSICIFSLYHITKPDKI